MLGKILKSSLFKSSGIYTITSIINASIPFLLIPVLTRVFSPEDYGIVSMAAIIINIVTPFIGVSAHGAIHRKYFEENKELDFPRYVGNAFLLLLFSTFALFILFLLFGNFISNYTAVPFEWLIVILLVGVCQFVTMTLLTIWQVKVKPFKYGVLQILQSILNAGFSLFFIYQLHYGWQSRLLGQLISVSITALISLFLLIKLKYVKFNYNKADLKDITSFSFPLIPHILGGLLIAFTDRILITNLISVTDTGVYTVAYQIGSVLGLVNTAFIGAYVPWLYNKLNLNDFQVKIKIVKFTYLYFLALILVVVFSVYILPLILSFLIGKSFQSAIHYILWIILGYAFNGMYLMVCGFIFYVKKTKLLSIVTLSTALLNIPLCYFFLKWFGTIGASISMAIIYFISFVATWYLSNKVYEMPWFSTKLYRNVA
ncbi:oligosaccharide flippase family protein [Flavobacterium sp. ZT3R18]|uniref:lipopolysaccharide biosynthesis protein n=1 Tax=Flavobacterium sp. ZT3R18 TaxID=2594429 RepID=UPI00117B41FE|nr:oligosaccharide flippase family protein [Flavobacterium sp. ZT3R18]TRX34806.1 oligosaccharide flippase family protein [Flavobacterium sp. ZT3R18]